jgi:hypothetical protein
MNRNVFLFNAHPPFIKIQLASGKFYYSVSQKIQKAVKLTHCLNLIAQYQGADPRVQE